MLKYNDIISQLSDSQKIKLLTSVGKLSGNDFKVLGLGGVSVRSMKNYGREIFPRAAALSHSWNEALWNDVARAEAQMIADDGADFVIVPGAKIKFSPYRREISEDPLLASRFSAAHAKAAHDMGIKTALSGYYLTESDVEWMDKEPDQRVINEFFVSPYLNSLLGGSADAVVTDMRALTSSYCASQENAQARIPEDKYLICESADEKNTVDFIARGIICLSASANALESALARYKKLKAAMENGKGITQEQIQNEQQNRTAISIETINEALDKVIGFMRERSSMPTFDARLNKDEIGKRAVVESTVLLKNRNDTLPLSTEDSIALIGGILPDDENGENLLFKFRDTLCKKGYNCIGAELGYDPDNIQNSDMTESALKLALSASVVILFMGFGYENEKDIPLTKTLELPANQLRLADMLVKRNKTVIGVIASGHAPDVAFSHNMSALLLTPHWLRSSASALASILTGEVSPSAKLAYTLYDDSDAAFKKRRIYKEKYGMKSGPFIGYRYYDLAEINVGYPFGHGLSYSEFKYSQIRYDKGSVSFTVENIGHIEASEVVQVYIGRQGSAVLRPKKELCGFTKVKLSPKARKRISIPVEWPAVYQSEKFRTEGGEYEIFVGSSSSDIRLSVTVNVPGEKLTRDGERLIDYIQSVTNVTEDNFTLEAKYCPMNKKSIREYKNLLIGFGALALAASLIVFNSAENLSSIFLGTVAGILAVVAVVFFISEMIDRNRRYENYKSEISKKNAEYFVYAEQVPVLSTDKMFNEEFDTPDEKSDVNSEKSEELLEEEVDKYIDTSFQLKDMAQEIARLFEEKGMRLDAGVADNVAVALTTSKMMIVDGMSSEDFDFFVKILSEYFDTKTYIEKIGSEIKTTSDFFFTLDKSTAFDAHADFVKRAPAMALADASMADEKVYLLGMDGMRPDIMEEFVKPFAGYLTSFKAKNSVQIYNYQGSNVGYMVHKNLKFIIRLADFAPIDMFSDPILRMSTYIRVGFVRCQATSAHAQYHGCNRYQLDYILKKESSAANVSEQVYKKIDKLESFVASHSNYGIGNKLWLALEKQIGLFLSLEWDIKDATDAAITMKLLPTMVVALRNNLKNDDETLGSTLEFIFGEENVSVSTKFINSLQEKYTRMADKFFADKAE